jgi:hypothetical protein
MKTFIQLKDNVGFAFVNTSGETEGIEVPFGTGEDYLEKTYDDGSWSVAPTIKYAVVDEFGNILEIRQTKFISQVGPWPQWNTDIPTYFKWIDGAWTDTTPIIDTTPIDPIITINLEENI